MESSRRVPLPATGYESYPEVMYPNIDNTITSTARSGISLLKFFASDLAPHLLRYPEAITGIRKRPLTLIKGRNAPRQIIAVFCLLCF